MKNEAEMSEKIDVFQLTLLSEIDRLGPDAYPAELARHMTSRLGRHVSIGQVFVALEQLEDRHMVSWTPIPKHNRRRKLFRLEEVGKRVVMTTVLISPGLPPSASGVV